MLRETKREGERDETRIKGVRDAMLQSASRCIWWENLLTKLPRKIKHKNNTLQSVRTIQGRFLHLLNKGRAGRKGCTCWILISVVSDGADRNDALRLSAVLSMV